VVVSLRFMPPARTLPLSLHMLGFRVRRSTPTRPCCTMLTLYRGIEQTTILTQRLADIGVDLIDVSSGGNDLRGEIKVGPSYRTSRSQRLVIAPSS
jgi:hypothetical protein